MLLEADVEHAAVQQLVVEQGVLGYVRSAVSGDAQIVSAKPSAAVRLDSLPPSSELSTGKMNPRVPRWNKRLRIGAAVPTGCLVQTGSVHSRRLCGVLLRTRLTMLSHQLSAQHLTRWVRRMTSTICTRGRRALAFVTGRAG
ncbi:hypothetical protein ACQJBY_003775 [Aegilops geniculata]